MDVNVLTWSDFNGRSRLERKAMKVSDLLDVQVHGIFNDKALKSDLVALDGRTGKVIFDTSKNKREYIEKFFDGEVLCLWADVKLFKGTYGDFFKPIMKCYVSHKSWEKGERE